MGGAKITHNAWLFCEAARLLHADLRPLLVLMP